MPMANPVNASLYVFEVAPELLEIDVVELDETLKTLLNEVPDNGRLEWKIIREKRSRAKSPTADNAYTSVICRLDRSQNIITAPSLGKKLMPFVKDHGSYLAIEPEKPFDSADQTWGDISTRTAPHRSYKVYPIQHLLLPTQKTNPLLDDDRRDGILFHRDEALDLIQQLANLPRVSPVRIKVHQMGTQLSLRRGFDTLLSLQTLRHLSPYPHQIRTAERTLRELRGRALLADEVGLGKTIEAGLILTEYIIRGLVRTALVLTPAPLVSQWQEELIRKFDLPFVSHDSRGFKDSQNAWSGHPYIVASLDTAKREPHRSEILNHSYDLVIVDEAHHLKNRSTLAWKFVNQLKKKYLLLLTATPIENSMEELFNLITLLKPGQLDTAGEYRQKFVDKKSPLQPKNVEELKRLIHRVMIRNRRSSTGIIESSRTAETVRVDPDGLDADFYRTLSTFIKQRMEPAGQTATTHQDQFVLKNLLRQAGSSRTATRATLQRLRADSNGLEELATIDALIDWANDLSPSSKMQYLGRLLQMAGKEQTVVFTGFLETQKAIVHHIRNLGIEVAEFHGGMSRGDKERAVAEFRDGVPVLVSTESGGEGRNLQFCHRLINFDVPWNPMRIEQRIGRIHRIGQTHDVYVANLVARGTIEEHIVHILDEKINMFQLVIGELDMIMGALEDQREFEAMVWDIWRKAKDDAHMAQGMETLGHALLNAKEKYQQIKEVDDALFLELIPDE